MTYEAPPDLYEGTFDLAEFKDDELTQAFIALNTTIARWTQARRDEAHATLGGLAIICATSSQQPDHRGTAELLTLLRRLIRATEQHLPSGDHNGNQA